MTRVAAPCCFVSQRLQVLGGSQGGDLLFFQPRLCFPPNPVVVLCHTLRLLRNHHELLQELEIPGKMLQRGEKKAGNAGGQHRCSLSLTDRSASSAGRLDASSFFLRW